MSEKLRVIIVTVDEYYYIPRFLRPVVESDEFDVVGITTVPPTLGTANMFSFAFRLFRTFGTRIFLKHGTFYAKYLLLDLLHRYRSDSVAYSPRTLAMKNGVEHRHQKDLNTDEYLEYAHSLAPDVIASVAATQRFNRDLLDEPSEGAINVHSSLLPEYRGVSPSFWTLLNGEDETGISVHYMAEEIDTGDLIRQRPIEIRDDDSLHSLNARVAEVGADVLNAALSDIASGTVTRTELDPDEGEYYSMPTRSDVRAFLRRGNTFY